MFDVLRAVPQAMRSTELVIAWAIATVQGSERDVAYTREYAAYWGVTERQGERDRADIRELFDAEEFERVIVAVANDLRARGVTTPSASLQAVEIAADLVPA